MKKVFKYDELGFRLRQMRQSAGYTQEQLGEKLGISSQMIQKYEAGRAVMSVKRLLELAQALSASVSDILFQTGESYPMQGSEQELLAAFRSIENAEIKECILRFAIYAAKVNGSDS